MLQIGPFPLDTIVQGDCIELLRKLPSGSVDLIFADPPYHLRLNRELYRPNQTLVHAVDDDWDKFESNEAYDTFCQAWLTECRRALKDNGSIWVIGTYHNIFRVGAIMQNLGFWVLNDIVWIKTNPMPNFKGTRFNNAHETLIWATKSKESAYTFHYQSMKTMNDDLQMRSDWLIPICAGAERMKLNGEKAHSTQKPEELLYRVLLSSSNPGDIVLDPFSGSGTTAAVALRLGRKFIAFEREADYVALGQERLKTIAPLNQSLLTYKVEKRKPKVPFGNLVASGYIRAGEALVSKDQRHTAQVQADASLVYEGTAGSIHKITAMIQEKETANGWTFWYVLREQEFVSIDSLRYEYETMHPLPSTGANEDGINATKTQTDPSES